jgi:queuine tRNA-ribosyltransferase
MPVGTVGSVKSVSARELEDLGATIILGNTYHLAVRPGVETLRELGGMHGMAAWRRSILTDSGGFQILSLAGLRKIDESGVTFRNHVNGGLMHLTPERSMEIQAAIGSDIFMCLDHLPPTTAPRKEIEEAMERTTRWARRCLTARNLLENSAQHALFAIIQGGLDRELRLRHVEELCAEPFDGFAIGGLSVGESIEEMYATAEYIAPKLPADRPRYLMGVGTPRDLVEGVARGVDMFDCVYPTRNARKGAVFADLGRRAINVRNARYRNERGPLEEGCPCLTCRSYGVGYLRHLLVAGELLALRLLTIHNLHVYLDLMRHIRRALRRGEFARFRRAWQAGVAIEGAFC